MADVLDIMDVERMEAPELTREKILNTSTSLKKKNPQAKTVKRPEGMHREVFALLYNENKDAPLMPTDTGYGYVPTKARLGMRQARFWAWTPFVYPGRSDGAIFHHWRRVLDETTDEYSKFNKKIVIPSYTDSEFATYLRKAPTGTGENTWSKQETDHLFDLANRFDLRFVVMADRWDRASFPERNVEDLKERYYEVCGILAKLQLRGAEKSKVFTYDAEHERKRKEQLGRFFERTDEQTKEEEQLLSELKKIEARKRERERKTQDLQKLISQADQQGEQGRAGLHGVNSNRARGQDRKVARRRIQVQNRPARVDTAIVEGAGIKFPDVRPSGVSLRSHRLKLPGSVGQKKIKALENMLAELNLEINPMPTEEVCLHFNELRSDLVLMSELKTALANCEYELQSLRHQYEALNPGMTLSIPAVFCPTLKPDDTPGVSNLNTTVAAIDANIIDIVGLPISAVATT